MAIISKRNIRLIKLFLVSPLLERVLISLYLAIFIAIILFKAALFEYPEIMAREKDFADLLETSLSTVTTHDEFIDWISTNIPVQFMSTGYSTFKIFGNMRMYQMRVEVPDRCLSKSSNYDVSFTTECNPIMAESTSAESISVTDSTLCNNAQCSEFTATTDRSFRVKSNTVSYPHIAFYFELDRADTTAFQQKLTNTKTNGWIDTSLTKVIVFEVLLIETYTKTLVNYQMQFESFAPYMYQTTLAKNITAIYNSQSFWNLAAAVLFIAVGILFFFKNVFEFGIQENKYVHVAEVVVAGLQIIWSICSLTNIATFAKFFDSATDISTLMTESKFFPLNNLMALVNVENIIFTLLIYILPFKFYSFITWSKYLQSFQKLASAVYRTLPSVILYFLTAICFILLWSLIFYDMLGTYNPYFDEYQSALLYFLFGDFSNEVMESSSSQVTDLALNLDLTIFYLIMTLMRYIVYLYFLAVIVEAYSRGSSVDFHQYTSYEVEDRRFVSDMIRKIEKFSKESLPQSDNAGKNSINRKMLVWLSFSSNDDETNNMMETIYNKLEDQNIHLVQFYSLNEVIQFLKYLFGLKPNLLHKSANQFRIVIDNTIEGDDEREKMQQEQPFDIDRIETLLNWLKFIGSRVPLMIYSPYKLKYELMLKLRLKYQLLYFSTSVSNLTKFSIMDNLENIMEAYEKEETMSISQSLGLDDIDTSNIDE